MRHLYIHVPFCAAKCRYCSFYSVPVQGHDCAALVNALIAEMNRAELESVRTVYIGGGSPTVLPANELLRLVEYVRNAFDIEQEFTVECNPGQGTRELLRGLRAAGVNRLSVGAQSFSEAELAFLGRSHTVRDIYRCLDAARCVGFANLSLDLMFAIPGSDAAAWNLSLRQALSFGPEHLSAYSLTVEPGTPLAADVEAGRVRPVDEETDRAMYLRTIDAAGHAGLEQYEISNFARPGRECLHNLAYWNNDAYLGVGPAAHSNEGRRRTANIADVAAYIAAVQKGESPVAETAELSPAEAACETAVLNLRRIRGIDAADFRERTGFDLYALFARTLETHCAAGLLSVTPETVALTPAALPVADTVLADFAAPD